MMCPECGAASRVLETRHQDEIFTWLGDHETYRRRVCKGCGHRWSTLEITLTDQEWIHKRVGVKK